MNKKIAITALVVSAFAGAVSLLSPIPPHWQDSVDAFYWPLVISSVMTVLHAGAAVLFFVGLSAYKAALRRAFLIIVLAVLLTAVATIQVPIFNVYNLWSSFWVKSGIIVLPFLVSGLAMFAGSRAVAQLVSVGGWVTKALAVLPLAIVAAIGVTLLPHATQVSSEIAFDASNAVTTITFVLFSCAGAIIWLVRSHIGGHYVQAMSWLALAMWSSALVLAVVVVHSFFSSAQHDAGSVIVNLSTVVAGLTWLRAGYVFTQTKDF